MSDQMDDDYYDCDYDLSDEQCDDDFDSVRESHGDAAQGASENLDPEYFQYTAVSAAKVLEIINSAVETVSKDVGISRDVAKHYLIAQKWDCEAVKESYRLKSRTSKNVGKATQIGFDYLDIVCAVCLDSFPKSQMAENMCGHSFCSGCWDSYLSVQVDEGKAYDVRCMDTKCQAFVGEEFVLRLLSKEEFRKKFQRQIFRDSVETHPNLSLCSTHDCRQVFFAEHPENKRVCCDKCQANFCFVCGCEYHLPCDCRTIRHWWRKVAEDSSTASYMAAHTKDCPNCEVNIEKNGGCNHMICRTCRHEFCWICLGDWKLHGTAYYDCNKYSAKKAEAAADKGAESQSAPKSSVARLALNKYLFYFQRWKNHEESLGLERTLFTQIERRVQIKVENREGSLIDWQYLMDAGKLLLKCRRALQYTYAFAYYLEDGPKRMLFEHLQAELESGIENLSFSIERAETVDVAGLQAQMTCAEFRRRVLFRDAKTLIVNLNLTTT